MINSRELKNILITRTDRLGDVILTLPLVSEAKRIFKRAKVYLLVKKYVEDLICDYEDIDGLLIEESMAGIFAKYKYFKDQKPDLVINVKPRFDLALLFFILRIKYRIGTGYRWYSFLYNLKVYEHRKNSTKHESDHNLNLLKQFFDEVDENKKFYFKYLPEERKDLNKKLSGILDEKFIIIHAGSGGSSKDLPIAKLSEFVNEISENFRSYKVILTGTKEENKINIELKNSINKETFNKLIDTSGILNLKELTILIDCCALFISNSTGPIHIAGALNRNIIGFYPNEKPMNEVRWKPLSDNTVILNPEVSGEMNSIRSEIFLNAVKKFLN